MKIQLCACFALCACALVRAGYYDDPYGDSDSDGLPDSWEMAHFHNLAQDGGDDTDGDGEDNLSEYRSGTDPTKANSVTRTARPLNISTRLQVLTDDNVLISGFIISGSAPKTVLVRALGPSLSGGVQGALADPTLELFNAQGPVAFNNDWKDSQSTEIQATTIPPPNEKESAILQTLAPGAYTAAVRGASGSTGVGLVEVYEIGSSQSAKLANISTRGFVALGDNVMIGGFIIGGGRGVYGSGTIRVLVRALGPSLTASGISNPLADPVLELYDSYGTVIGSNDNWRQNQQAEIQATGIPPSNDLEAAIVQTLPAGGATAIVRGNAEVTGVALVEVYTLD